MSAPRKEVLSDTVTLWLGDMHEVLPTIGRVDAVLTDPPFEKEAHTAIRRTHKSIRSGVPDALDFEAITDDIRDFVSVWAAKNCDGWFLAFCQVEAVSDWRHAMERAGSKYKRGMAWVKPDSSPQFNGQGPAQGYECIASAWCGLGHSVWFAGGKRGVYTHLTNAQDREGTHPTEKPIRLMSELLKDFTGRNDLVCDPFCGSGTTGVSCVNLGRSFIGIEIDEKYFDVARRRISEALASPRLPFDELVKPKQEALL